MVRPEFIKAASAALSLEGKHPSKDDAMLIALELGIESLAAQVMSQIAHVRPMNERNLGDRLAYRPEFAARPVSEQ